MSFSVKKTGGRMWHEARKQEKKIRGMLVDYRRRAERRRDYYEKIKSDPTQFLQLHGRPCKVHLDPVIAAAGDSPANMMPWQGNKDNLIDRFDVRAHLDWIPEATNTNDIDIPLTSEDRHINYERYRIIVQNEFLTVTEEKFLHQIHLEEQFGSSTKLEFAKDKKKSSNTAAIGYNYETEEAISEISKTIDPNLSEEKEDEDSDIDLDICVDVSQIEPSQAHEMNLVAQKYGLLGADYFSFLTQDFEEAETLRQARKQEEEKAMYSGRRSRRERRAFREKKMIGRIMSPPSYAARESPEYNPYRKSSSKSHSRSASPANAGQITYITSFGGEEDAIQGSSSQVINSKKSNFINLKKRKPDSPISNDKLSNKKLVKSRSRSNSCSKNKPYRKNDSRRFSPSYSRSRRNSRNRKYGRSKTWNHTRWSRSFSRSRSRGRSRSRTDSRSRSFSQTRSISRSRSRSRIRSRSHSYSKRSSLSSSRSSTSSSESSRYSRSFSRSKSKDELKKQRFSESKSRSKSRTKTESRSRSRSRSMTTKSRSKSESRSRSKTKSMTRSRTRSRSRSRSKSHSRSKSSRSRSRSNSKRSKSIENKPTVSRYYGRRGKSSSLEIELSDNETKNFQSVSKTSTNSNMNKPKAGLSTNSGGGHKSLKITPQERLKKKMQTLLNRQYKADKKAEQARIEKMEQQRQDREDEIREMSLKLRRKQRERRHRYEGHSSDSRSSESRSPSPSRSSRSSTRKDRRDREYRNDYEGDCDRDRTRQKRNDDKDKSSRQDLRKRYRTPPRHSSPRNNRYKFVLFIN
ncbi:PREDICTED: CLK4-associating serine/arginine rich protein, partial [Ceratosolen solmsi marchali]|uniref:CLK4-associating serine/arginine rich protein n=1 Tax=Ceratosolen solmsi marchali TaxID=326594 RepID=A0AAJ6YVU1_9HYME